MKHNIPHDHLDISPLVLFLGLPEMSIVRNDACYVVMPLVGDEYYRCIGTDIYSAVIIELQARNLLTTEQW